MKIPQPTFGMMESQISVQRRGDKAYIGWPCLDDGGTMCYAYVGAGVDAFITSLLRMANPMRSFRDSETSARAYWAVKS